MHDRTRKKSHLKYTRHDHYSHLNPHILNDAMSDILLARTGKQHGSPALPPHVSCRMNCAAKTTYHTKAQHSKWVKSAVWWTATKRASLSGVERMIAEQPQRDPSTLSVAVQSNNRQTAQLIYVRLFACSFIWFAARTRILFRAVLLPSVIRRRSSHVSSSISFAYSLQYSSVVR